MVALSSYKFPAANLICQISEKGALTLANIFEKLQISEIKVCRLYFLIYFYKISIYLCIHCFIAFLTYSFDLPIWPIHLNYLNYIILPHPYNLSQYLQCFFNTHCCCQLKRWHWTCKYNSLKTLQVRIRVDVKSCMDWTLCSVCGTTRGGWTFSQRLLVHFQRWQGVRRQWAEECANTPRHACILIFVFAQIIIQIQICLH